MAQQYHLYTNADQYVWKTLFSRQMEQLPGLASTVFLQGVEAAGFRPDAIPDFEKDINPRLQALTGWKVVDVPGLIPEMDFFIMLSQRQFPASTWLRSPDQIDYLEEPDMFHDTFGHIPVLTNQAFCDFLSRLSEVALRYIDSPEAIEYIKRLYWYTVEFGLIHEKEGLKIYGGRILSSAGETTYSLYSDIPHRYKFQVPTIMQTVVKIDAFQKQYFVIDSYEQLYESIAAIETYLEKQWQVA